ncbi:MAG: hypothetical protein U0Q18_04090 [Bryobacteraceae bacterium]
MGPLLLAVLLPGLYWDQPVDTAQSLQKAGIERVYVDPAQVSAWQTQGFTVLAFDRQAAVKATVPGVQYRMDVASATTVPWIDANGWQFARAPSRRYFYEASKGTAALSAAEAFAYGVEAAVQAAPEDLDSLVRMLHFLSGLDSTPLPARANFGVIDDGSDVMGEVLNLMSRHNLLFQIVPAPDPKLDLNVRLGTPEYPTDEAADPYAFAIKLRHKLTDEKRLLRIYGSNVVLGRLTGDEHHAKVQLLNYGRNTVKGLRVRVLGTYKEPHLAAFGHDNATVRDFMAENGATEFTIPDLTTYAAVDLR